MITTTVPWITWFWPGHSTFLSSDQDEAMKLLWRSSGSPGWVRTAGWRSERASAMGLARFPVRGMAAAPAAVLAEHDAVRGVPLGLHRLVVPPLALRAGERDRNSDSGLGHVSSLSKWLTSGLERQAR